jgi:hypothetical protein
MGGSIEERRALSRPVTTLMEVKRIELDRLE